MEEPYITEDMFIEGDPVYGYDRMTEKEAADERKYWLAVFEEHWNQENQENQWDPEDEDEVPEDPKYWLAEFDKHWAKELAERDRADQAEKRGLETIRQAKADTVPLPFVPPLPPTAP